MGGGTVGAWDKTSASDQIIRWQSGWLPETAVSVCFYFAYTAGIYIQVIFVQFLQPVASARYTDIKNTLPWIVEYDPTAIGIV